MEVSMSCEQQDQKQEERCSEGQLATTLGYVRTSMTDPPGQRVRMSQGVRRGVGSADLWVLLADRLLSQTRDRCQPFSESSPLGTQEELVGFSFSLTWVKSGLVPMLAQHHTYLRDNR